MIGLFKSERKPSALLRGAWLVLGFFAVFPFSIALLYDAAGILTDFQTLVSSLLFLLVIAGWWLNWGFTIPCFFFGMMTLVCLTDPVTSSPQESFQVDFVFPLVGAVFGGLAGMLLDLGLSSSLTSGAADQQEEMQQ